MKARKTYSRHCRVGGDGSRRSDSRGTGFCLRSRWPTSTADAGEAALDNKSAPADLPKLPGERGPQTVRVDLETVEATGKLEFGASYNYRTPKTDPGPSVRGSPEEQQTRDSM
jgi:hypothetical protein